VLEAICKALADDSGFSGVVINSRDISERRQLEEQLRQSQKMEAVGRLAGGVAHDFNNLLTAISGYSELMLRRLRQGDPLRHNAEEINKAGNRAASLTSQLLAFSRKQVLQPKVLDLNIVVADMDKMLRRLIGEHIELVTILEPQLWSIRADPGQLQQVILNLAVNARDAMPEVGRLTIETSNIELDDENARWHVGVRPGRYVMLAVNDTGFGMDSQTRERVFEPFFTTKEVGKGTGLGLATVYGIVKQSGGYVWVYSEPGRGTTFKVYLPRVDAPAEAVARPRETGTLVGTETILLAEDDETLRPLAKGLLEKLGYRVLDAENAERALALAAAHGGPIHLLVADVVMPGASGRELARRLAQTRPDTKVLYISGYTDDAIVHHGMLEPGLHFLQKPFTPAALARKVRDVLDRS
jgi:nitrogen-specific signal transduction histidine kinase